jgi:hypothetical protein
VGLNNNRANRTKKDPITFGKKKWLLEVIIDFPSIDQNDPAQTALHWFHQINDVNASRALLPMFVHAVPNIGRRG